MQEYLDIFTYICASDNHILYAIFKEMFSSYFFWCVDNYNDTIKCLEWIS